jgi:4'-phosphopantetheinyl transferase EntD
MVGFLVQLLPATVSVVESFDGSRTLGALLVGEEPATAAVNERRRREFANGRTCARAALRRAGVAATPIPVGHRGAPIWPPGIVGSITHCADYCAAAVARRHDVNALGVDAEVVGGLPDGVLEVVCRPDERAEIRALTVRRADVAWGTLWFSAKESVHKAWFPLHGQWLDPLEARLTVRVDTADRPGGTFVADLPSTAAVGRAGSVRLNGRWLQDGGYCFTAVAVEPTPGDGVVGHEDQERSSTPSPGD